MCFLCLGGLHIPSRRAHLVLDGELGKRESIHHDDMFLVGSMKKVCMVEAQDCQQCGGMKCGDRLWRWF